MTQVRLDTFDNSWYQPGSIMKRFFWYLINAIFFNSYFFPFSNLKVFLLKMFGAKIGKGVVIKPKVNIKYPWNLHVGDHTWIGEEVWIDNLADVHIGSHVCISQGALLLLGSHDYQKTTFDLKIAPITIENGVWICARAIVLGGTKMADHSMITALSIAPKKTEPYGIYRGNPVEKIGERKFKSQ